MSAHNTIDYKPAPTVRDFIVDYTPGKLFYDWIVGPVGSGKTTGLFMKLVYMAQMQAPQPDGIRRSRAVVVRNTAPQLNDTTLTSWFYWFKPGQAGSWSITNKTFVLKFGDVECEVLFRPLDTADDVNRVLSLEVTFVLIDEFVQIPKAIVDALSARCGRYPAKKDGGATNWGMWGSSNPSTEDNWWFDHLHGRSVKRFFRSTGNADADRMIREFERNRGVDGAFAIGTLDGGTVTIGDVNETYFKQPSALGPDAENIENLPGERGYYDSVTKGKSDEWIKQFVECEWGFSVAGKPVIAAFKPQRHISHQLLRYNPHLPLVAGFDPGLAGSALVFGQQDFHGRLLVLGELVQENMGSERIISERLKPYLRRRFPDARLIVAPDPASNNRGQRDEVAVIQPFKDKFDVSIESNNRLPLRVDALDHFCTYLTDVGEALLVDENMCPNVVRALKGGWRFAMDSKKDQIKGVDPEKNAWSHVGDATGYLARYFHRQQVRELRYGVKGGSRFVPPRKFGPSYHQT